MGEWIEYYQLESLETNGQVVSFRGNPTTNTIMFNIFLSPEMGEVLDSETSASFGYTHITLISRLGLYDTSDEDVKRDLHTNV